MVMTKLDFFDKHVKDENSRTLLSQAKYTLKLLILTVNYLSLQMYLAEMKHNTTYLLWKVYLNIQLSKTVLQTSKSKVIITKHILSNEESLTTDSSIIISSTTLTSPRVTDP